MKLRHLIYLAFHLFYVSPCDDNSSEANNRKFVKSYTHCTDKNRSCTVVEFSFQCSVSAVEECHVQPRHIYQSPLQVLAESANENNPKDEKPSHEVIALVWFATLLKEVDPTLEASSDPPLSSPSQVLPTPPLYSPVVSLSQNVTPFPASVANADVPDAPSPEPGETRSNASSDEPDALEADSRVADESFNTAPLGASATSDEGADTDVTSDDTEASKASPIALLPQMLDPIPVLGPFLSAMIAPSMESLLSQPHDGTVWERLVNNVFPHESRSTESTDPTASPDIPFHSGGAPPPREGPALTQRKLAERSYVPLAGALDEDPWLSQAFETKAVEYLLSALRTPLTVAALTVAPHEEVQEVFEETQRKQENKSPVTISSDLPPMWPNVASKNEQRSSDSSRRLVADALDPLSPLLSLEPPSPLVPLVPLQGGLPFLDTIAQLQPLPGFMPQASEAGADARGDRSNPTTTDMLPWIPLDSIAGEFPVWLGEALIGPFALLFEDLVRVAQDAFIRLQVIIDAVGNEPVPVASENLQTFLEKMSQAFRTSLAGNEADALKSLAVTIQEMPVLPDLAKDKIVTPEGSSVAQVLSQFDSLIENMKHHTGRLLAAEPRAADEARASNAAISEAEFSQKLLSKKVLDPEEFKYLAASSGNGNRPTTSDLLPWRPLDAIVGEYPKYLKDRGNEIIESITDSFKEGGTQIAHMLFPFLPSQDSKSASSPSPNVSRPQQEKVYPQQEKVYPQQLPSISTAQNREPNRLGWGSESARESHEFVDDDDATNIQWVSNDGHTDRDKKDVKERVADAWTGALEMWPGLLKQFLSENEEEHAEKTSLHSSVRKATAVREKLFHTLDAQDAEQIVLEEAERSKAASDGQKAKLDGISNDAKSTGLSDQESGSAQCDSVCKMTVEMPCDKLSSFREMLQGFLSEEQREHLNRRPEQASTFDLSAAALPNLDPSLWTSLALSPSANPMEDLLHLMPPAYIPMIDAWLEDTRQTLARHAGEIEVPPFLDPWLTDDNSALNLIDLVGQLAAARSTDLRSPIAAVEEARTRQEQAYNEWLARTQAVDIPSLNDILERIQPPPIALPLSLPVNNNPSSPDSLLNSLLSTLMQLPQPPIFALSEREVDPVSVLQRLGLYAQELDVYWQDLAKALERISVTQPPLVVRGDTSNGAMQPGTPGRQPSFDGASSNVVVPPLPYANLAALPSLPYRGVEPSVPDSYLGSPIPAETAYGQSAASAVPAANHQPPLILPEYADMADPGDVVSADQAPETPSLNVDLLKDVILGGLDELNRIGSTEYSKTIAKLKEARNSARASRSAGVEEARQNESNDGARVESTLGGDPTEQKRRLFEDQVVVTSDHNVVQFSEGSADEAVKQLEGILSSILGTFGVPSPFAHLASDPRELLNSFFEGNHDKIESPPSSDELKQRAQQGASNIIQGLAETLLSEGPRLPTVSPDDAAEYNEIQQGRGHAGVEPLNRVPARVANPTSHLSRSAVQRDSNYPPRGYYYY